jgi:hypothetical protein
MNFAGQRAFRDQEAPMNRSKSLPALAATVFLALGLPAVAQDQNTSTSEKMNPQPQANTATAPAGVSDPSAVEKKTQGMTGAQTGCKSASAEMTNGKVETCKQ